MTHNQTPDAGSAAKTCPRCGSKDPALHPAMQFEGEVQECAHPFHTPAGSEVVTCYECGGRRYVLDVTDEWSRWLPCSTCNKPPTTSRQQPDVAGKDKLTADDPPGLYQCKVVRNGMRAFAEWDGHKLWMLAFEGKVLSGDEYTDFIGPLVPASPPIAADDRAELERLRAENDRLRIRLLSAAGDDLCRLSQDEIKELSSGAVKIPPKEEFLASCERFHQQIASGPGVLSDCLTLAQLIAEAEQLRQQLATAEQRIAALEATLDKIAKAPEFLEVRQDIGSPMVWCESVQTKDIAAAALKPQEPAHE